jgi:hypothetical protein
MANELHCPQCLTRITPYEDEVNDKATPGVKRNACWHCGLPMEDVLAKQSLIAKPDRRSDQEKELADLRAELARLKAEQNDDIVRRAHAGEFTQKGLEKLYGKEFATELAGYAKELTGTGEAPEKGHGEPVAVAEPAKPKGLPSTVEAASHRGPGRPAGKK